MLDPHPPVVCVRQCDSTGSHDNRKKITQQACLRAILLQIQSNGGDSFFPGQKYSFLGIHGTTLQSDCKRLGALGIDDDLSTGFQEGDQI